MKFKTQNEDTKQETLIAASWCTNKIITGRAFGTDGPPSIICIRAVLKICTELEERVQGGRLFHS